MIELLQKLHNKKIAIVGNGKVDKNYSDEINSADVVVRFNHFYNIDSGLVGEKTNIVFQTFTTAWQQAQNKHLNILQKYKAEIYVAKKVEQYQPWVHQFLGNTIKVSDATRFIKPFDKYTTGGATLCWLARDLQNAEVHIYGFPFDENWKNYIMTNAKHYQNVANEELRSVCSAIEILKGKKIDPENIHDEKSPHIIIPCRRIPFENVTRDKEYIKDLLKQLKPCSDTYEITVITDDPEICQIVSSTKNKKVSAFPVAAIPQQSDVTDTLRQWKYMTNFDGKVIIIKPSSFAHCKTIKWKETIEACLSSLQYAPITATCTKAPFRPNEIYRIADGGTYIQSFPEVGYATKPKNQLPSCVVLNGWIVCTHSDSLDLSSYYAAGRMEPIILT